MIKGEGTLEKFERDALLEQLMVTYGDELVRLAYCYVHHEESAKDIVQASFVKCYKQLHTFEQRSQYKTWLYRIVINEAKDYLKSWHYKKVQLKSFMQETTRTIKPSVEKTLLKKEQQAHVREIIFTLPTIYRDVVHLYYFESLSIEEISDLLQLSTNTIKTRLRRAKERLGTMLQEVDLYE